MKFCRLLRYEFTEQIIKNRRYLIVPLFTWFYCLQISGLFYNINPDLHASIGDYLLYIFSGTDPFVKSGQFEYPFFWMALLIISFFVITGFVQKDLHGYGAQMLIRSSTRKKWWASKCVSCILMSAVFVALAAMEEFHLSCHQRLLKLPQMEHILQHRITSILMQEQQQHYC